MPSCEFCRSKAVQLVRSTSRVWFGCRHCHHTWNVDVESCRTAITDPAPAAEGDPSTHRTSLRGLVIASLAVASALILRMLLRPALGDASPFLLFTPAVAIGAIYGGAVPGALAIGLSTFLGSHFLLGATGEPVIEKWDRVALFVVVGIVITTSTALLRRSRLELTASLWREQKARAVAEAADRAKEDFLAVISHELRTPMSVVIGWIGAIREQRINPDAVDHAFDAIERNAQILSRLVDDVLDRSRIATGTLRIDPQLISLTTIVRAAIDQMRTKIETAGLHLSVIEPIGDPMIVGDSIRLQQVFTNLLSNAIKFTPAEGRIAVTATITPRTARIVVADTGRGISADLLPHVFDAFRQGPDTLTQSFDGLGLGLSISRYLIGRHHGVIEVTSDGAGHGSAFTITLPLAPQPPQSMAAMASASERHESLTIC